MNAVSNYTLLGRRMLQPPACHPNCSGSGSGGSGSGGSGSGGTSGGGAEALGTAAGIMLTGGYMYNALAAGNLDAVEGEADTLDVCLCHPSPQSEFHYHFWGACMEKNKGYWSDTVAPPLCRDTGDCVDSPGPYQLSASAYGQSVTYSAATWDSPIGLAKDGHVILGPYKSDGTTWGCADRDVCNGAFVDGSYVYVGSDTFPYVVGCWGPGPAHQYVPGCTNSGCGP